VALDTDRNFWMSPEEARRPMGSSAR